MADLLRIRGLRSCIRSKGGAVIRAVDDVDLTLAEGEARGLVGESGAGKTMLALSILGLLPPGGEVESGSSIRLNGEELVGAGDDRLREVRGREVAMVFQEPGTALNPVLRVGTQIEEVLVHRRGAPKRQAEREAARLLEEVGFSDPRAILGSYAHRLSGGMRQRVCLAMALAGRPSVLIADEPTTALDVTVQAQILRLLKDLRERHRMALLLITHDFGIVSGLCGQVTVLYGGRVVEEGETREVLARPKHPYTRGLLGARLSVGDRRAWPRPIPGEAPDAGRWPDGCRFHPRCTEALGRCSEEEPPLSVVAGAEGAGTAHHCRCWLWEAGGRRKE